jgi:(R)-2-hydroxyglutarate---pyruvate transhydrogenase
MKTHAIQYSKSAIAIDVMRRIKYIFDPHGIMNPGKVLE